MCTIIHLNFGKQLELFLSLWSATYCIPIFAHIHVAHDVHCKRQRIQNVLVNVANLPNTICVTQESYTEIYVLSKKYLNAHKRIATELDVQDHLHRPVLFTTAQTYGYEQTGMEKQMYLLIIIFN